MRIYKLDKEKQKRKADTSKQNALHPGTKLIYIPPDDQPFTEKATGKERRASFRISSRELREVIDLSQTDGHPYQLLISRIRQEIAANNLK